VSRKVVKCAHRRIGADKRCKECGILVDLTEKRSKYRNKKVDGFDSKKEKTRYEQLCADPMVMALNRQKSYDLVVNDVKICSYRDDFNYLRIGPDHVARAMVEDVKPRGKAFKKTAAYRMFVVKKNLMLGCLGIEVQEI
jgi:hypothetical protein